MNALAEEFYHRTGYAATEWAVINFKAGGQAMHDIMIEDMKKIVEALDKIAFQESVYLKENDYFCEVRRLNLMAKQALQSIEKFLEGK